MRQTTDCWQKRKRKHTKVLRSAPELDHVPFRMCGCTASFKPGGPRLDVLYTRPVKPRQSGRTILIRSAKQYISFHMPTQSTSTKEAGCCCDAALGQSHYRSTQFKSIIMSSCRGINVTSDVRTLTHCMQHCMRKHTEHTQ